MGNNQTSSKRQTKEVKTQKQAVRAQIQEQRAEDLAQFQQTILQGVRDNDTPENHQQAYMMYTAAETAKAQLNRGGEQFTKNDLIAIIKLIDKTKPLQVLRSLTCDDLRAIIRGKIYDISQYIPSNAENVNYRLENAANTALPETITDINPDLEEMPTIQRRKKTRTPSPPITPTTPTSTTSTTPQVGSSSYPNNVRINMGAKQSHVGVYEEVSPIEHQIVVQKSKPKPKSTQTQPVVVSQDLVAMFS